MDANQLFSELKTELFKRQLSNSENFDKAILTYASGALALSLAFLKDFVPLAGACSWMLFALCITITVASYLMSQLGIKRQLRLAERYYLEKDESALKETNTSALCTEYFNLASGTCFCVAVFLTTGFIASNAMEASMSRERRHTNDGAPVPSLQKITDPGFGKGAPVPAITPVPGGVAPAVPSHVVQPAPSQPASSAPKGGESKK
jgi:hypothetical protein